MSVYAVASRVGTTPATGVSGDAKAALVTLWAAATSPVKNDEYVVHLVTGAGGFSDSVNVGAFATASTLQTRQKQEERMHTEGWTDYSDLLTAVFTRLRAAANKAIDLAANSTTPLPGNLMLQLLQNNPVGATGAADELAKQCIRHFHSVETLRSAGRLSVSQGAWQTPAQWKSTARLAQAAMTVDPDNVPAWEQQLHHASEAEHNAELKGVLALTEVALFCTDRAARCTVAEAAAIEDKERYTPRVQKTGAAAAAWLWHALATNGSGVDPVGRLEAAHCSTLPFGSADSSIQFATDVYAKIISMDRVLAVAEPNLPVTQHTPTVSFGANFLSPDNKIAPWGVGVASTAIEEALQLAVATLYQFTWKDDTTVIGGGQNVARVRALLSAPMLQGQTVYIEDKDRHNENLVSVLDMTTVPTAQTEMIATMFKKIASVVDAVNRREGKLVIRFDFDTGFYEGAQSGWDPDTAYRVNRDAPLSFSLSAAATAREAMNALMRQLIVGMPDAEYTMTEKPVSAAGKTVRRLWSGQIALEKFDKPIDAARLQANLLEALQHIQRRQTAALGTATFADPSVAAGEPASTWASASFAEPPGAETYVADKIRPRANSGTYTRGVLVRLRDRDAIVLVHDIERVYNLSAVHVRNPVVGPKTVAGNWPLTANDVNRPDQLVDCFVYVKPDGMRFSLYMQEKNNEARLRAQAAAAAAPTMEDFVTQDRIMLDDVQQTYRQYLQVYFVTKTGQLWAAAVTKSDNSRTHIVYEDGKEGDVKTSDLVVHQIGFVHPHIFNNTAMQFRDLNRTMMATVKVTYDQLTLACQRRPRKVPVAIYMHNATENKIVTGFAHAENDNKGNTTHFFEQRLTPEGEQSGPTIQLDPTQQPHVYVRVGAQRAAVHELGAPFASTAAVPTLHANDIAPSTIKTLLLQQKQGGLWQVPQSVSAGIITFEDQTPVAAATCLVGITYTEPVVQPVSITQLVTGGAHRRPPTLVWRVTTVGGKFAPTSEESTTLYTKLPGHELFLGDGKTKLNMASGDGLQQSLRNIMFCETLFHQKPSAHVPATVVLESGYHCPVHIQDVTTSISDKLEETWVAMVDDSTRVYARMGYTPAETENYWTDVYTMENSDAHLGGDHASWGSSMLGSQAKNWPINADTGAPCTIKPRNVWTVDVTLFNRPVTLTAYETSTGQKSLGALQRSVAAYVAKWYPEKTEPGKLYCSPEKWMFEIAVNPAHPDVKQTVEDKLLNSQWFYDQSPRLLGDTRDMCDLPTWLGSNDWKPRLYEVNTETGNYQVKCGKQNEGDSHFVCDVEDIDAWILTRTSMVATTGACSVDLGVGTIKDVSVAVAGLATAFPDLTYLNVAGVMPSGSLLTPAVATAIVNEFTDNRMQARARAVLQRTTVTVEALHAALSSSGGGQWHVNTTPGEGMAIVRDTVVSRADSLFVCGYTPATMMTNNLPLSSWPTWDEAQARRQGTPRKTKRAAEEDAEDTPYTKKGSSGEAFDRVTAKLARQHNAGDPPEGVFADTPRQPAAVSPATGVAADDADSVAQRYRAWRHIMDANKKFVDYYSDPLPSKNTEVHIAFQPTPYVVRVNNRVTHLHLEDALLDGKVLCVPNLEATHIDSVDATLCWKFVDGRVGAHVEGEAADKTYVATMNVASAHTAVAGAFGGWHYGRATEPRQTAHALLCGPLHKQVVESIPTDAALDKRVFKTLLTDAAATAKAQCEKFGPFEHLQSLCPELVSDHVVIVKGPGRDAAGTPCRVGAIKHLTDTARRVVSEANSLLQAMRSQLPRRIAADALSSKYEGKPLPSVDSMLVTPNLTTIVARVLVEVTLMDSVRAGAGKRYHHGLPVRAGQVALRTACRDLLLASV